jgi:CRP-like cAMP-binding protein
MESRSLVQVLAKLRFSAPLPQDVLEKLAAAAVLVGFPSGATLFREGSPNDRLMIVAVGRVALDMRVPGRREVRILTLGPGDMVAWSSLLGEGRMTTSATAAEDTQVVSVPAADIAALCEANHTFGYYLMQRLSYALADRLVATRLQLLDLFSESEPATSL